MLPDLRAGDIIAVLDAGAYGFAMSSQYTQPPPVPEVILFRRERGTDAPAETSTT